MAKISDLKHQEGDKSRMSVFIDGEFAFGMTVATVASLKLKIGQEVDVEQLKATAQTDYAYSRALNYLSFRMRSSDQIRRYLYEKEFSSQAIELAIEKLILNRYIDDAEFAVALARSYEKKEGKKGVKSRLIRAGIDQHIISEVLDYDESDGALKTAQKYLRTREFDREKLWRHLYGKGFCSDTISSTIEKLQNGEQDEF